MRLISFICALFFLAAPIFAGDKEDIQATISRQLEAFQLDDFAEAFSYASPSIQSIFGDLLILNRWSNAAILWSGNLGR